MPFRSMGALEIGLILVIVLIIFGVGKLPQIGGAIGKSIKDFKRARDGLEIGEGESSTKVTKVTEDEKKS